MKISQLIKFSINQLPVTLKNVENNDYQWVHTESNKIALLTKLFFYTGDMVIDKKTFRDTCAEIVPKNVSDSVFDEMIEAALSTNATVIHSTDFANMVMGVKK